RQLDEFILEEGDRIRLQPCLSPVWDTALSLFALAEGGATIEDGNLRGAVDWLLQREVKQKGDWSIGNPRLNPGGWFFEYRNPHYPDTDDTAMVLRALHRVGAGAIPEVSFAMERGLNWLIGMQNSDGGWAAFDRDINREILTRVPFADHNAMLDPSCPDITARVLEALGYFGYRPGNRQVDQALDFIRRTQEREGCWIGRWGVNYLYGTWQVLQGLHSVG